MGWNRAKKTVVLEYGCIWSSVVTNVRQGANHRIGGGGESHQTSGTIMIKVSDSDSKIIVLLYHCYRPFLW